MGDTGGAPERVARIVPQRLKILRHTTINPPQQPNKGKEHWPEKSESDGKGGRNSQERELKNRGWAEGVLSLRRGSTGRPRMNNASAGLVGRGT